MSNVPSDVDEPSSEDGPVPRGVPNTRQRWATALAGMVGGGVGVLMNYFVYAAVGEGYPIGPTSFLFVATGAFGAMRISDGLGKRALRITALAAGILLASALVTLMVLSG